MDDLNAATPNTAGLDAARTAKTLTLAYRYQLRQLEGWLREYLETEGVDSARTEAAIELYILKRFDSFEETLARVLAPDPARPGEIHPRYFARLKSSIVYLLGKRLPRLAVRLPLERREPLWVRLSSLLAARVSRKSAEVGMELLLPTVKVLGYPSDKQNVTPANGHVTAPPEATLMPPVRPKPKQKSLSERDENVYKLIGEDNFKSLTNAEIARRFGNPLRKLTGNAPTSNVVRSILGRIRRRYNLPACGGKRK